MAILLNVSFFFNVFCSLMSIMALRGVLFRLLVNPQRCAIISASRSQGTAAPARQGEYDIATSTTESVGKRNGRQCLGCQTIEKGFYITYFKETII